MASHHPSEKDLTKEHSASGFTAVNNRDSLPSRTITRSEVVGKASNESAVPQEQHVSNKSNSRQHSPPLAHEAPHPEPPSGNSQFSPPREMDTPASSLGKRRRSTTDDERGSSGSSHYDLSPPRRITASPAGLVDHRIERVPEADGSHPTYINGTNGGVDSHNPRGHGNHWQGERQVPPGYQNGNGHHMDPSDAQLAEALQSETRAQNSHRTWGVGDCPDDDAADQQGACGTSDRGSEGAAQPAPKRKRVFSNRTKTGCMTCRRRKKKCDEGHPFCNNCLRGAFACEGYNTRTTWAKQSHTKGPVPLQSKDDYEGCDQAESNSPHAKRDSIPYEGTHQMRPIVVDDGDHQAQYMTSPTSAGPQNRSSFTQPWVRNPPYLPEQPRQDLPSFSEIAGEPGKLSYGVPPIREYSRTHGTSQQSSGSPWSAPPADYRKGYAPGPVDPRSLQGVAREGLNMEETQRPTVKNDDIEKEKMLKGQIFKYNDPLLVEDRKRCKIALKQFHDADNPTMGVAETERTRKLREVFAPTRDPLTNMPYPYKWDPMGAIGTGCVVETPFKCQYGYNIQIAEDVYIGENCTIVDSCKVSIAARCWIGQNVQILTSMAHTSMAMRAGSEANWQGKAVTIDEDSHIGAGSIIYPGVTIRRGAQVEPGTVVKKDVSCYAMGSTLGFMG